MALRAYDFDSGVETPSAPSVSPPAAVGDVIVLGATNSFTIANNTGPSNVTNLVFDKASIRSFIITFTIYRSASGGSTRAQTGFLMGVTDGTNWEISHSSVSCPDTDDAGVDFTITSAGQVQYTSDDNGGVYDAATSQMEWELLQLMAV